MRILSVNAVENTFKGGEGQGPLSGLILVAAKDLADALDVSESSLWSWIDRQSPHFVEEFPRPIKIGKNCTRWRLDDVAKYLAKAAEVRHVQ